MPKRNDYITGGQIEWAQQKKGEIEIPTKNTSNKLNPPTLRQQLIDDSPITQIHTEPFIPY